jgi:hypothetical protein
MIFNISEMPLTIHERRLLNKGLTFCPSMPPDQQKIEADMDDFERRLQLRYHFTIIDGQNEALDLNTVKKSDLDSRFGKTKSSFQPKITNDRITNFRSVLTEATKSLMNKPFPSNLSTKERQALKALQKRSDIIIKPCDKGAGICILTAQQYEQKCYELLNITRDYIRVCQDDTETTFKEANAILIHFVNLGIISKKEFEGLTCYKPTTPLFYGLPKIHKEGCPLRPIVSQTTGPTKQLNRLADLILTKTEGQIRNLVGDTKTFLSCILDLEIPPNTLLVTMDIASLYTNIPTGEGIGKVVDAYRQTENPTTPTTPELLERTLRFIMDHNTFQFNGELFRQTHGTAMGAAVAVKYANIFTDRVWTELTADEPFLPFYSNRLLDDLFLLWSHGEEKLQRFYSNINRKHPTIKFDMKFSRSEINFLDTLVRIEGKRLLTKPFVKPTDRQAYLDFHSAHPIHTKRSIPYSQALRFRRNTTSDQDLEMELSKLKDIFVFRNYPGDFVDRELGKVKRFEQTDLLIQREGREMTRTPLVIDFHPTLDDLPKTARTLWERKICAHRILAPIFPDPMLVAFRKTKSLRNLLVKARYPARGSSPDKAGGLGRRSIPGCHSSIPGCHSPNLLRHSLPVRCTRPHLPDPETLPPSYERAET